MKRFLTLLLALLLLALSATALAESGEWEFDASHFTLKKYTGAGGDVVVPDKIGSAEVNVLDTGVLAQVAGMTSLTLPEGVLHIKDNVAWWNPELVQVSLPQSLMIIGSNSFNDCDALESVTIPAGVRYIGNGAFSDSELLKSVTFEGVCPTFDGVSFEYLADDAVAYVPDDQLDAYQAAFAAMESEIRVQPSGKNAVMVENNGFKEGDFEFDAATGTITRYNGAAVYMRIPEAIGGAPVKAVGENAFQFNRNLAYVALPEGLEVIQTGAFANCFTLLHVDFPATLQTIGDDAFSGSYLGYTLELPSVQTIGARAFEHAWLRGELTLPEGLESIGERAFTNCTSLRELYLPATLKSIGSAAFYQNWNLNYVYMDGVTLPEVAADAFIECSALEDIDLNEHCTKQQMLDMQALVDGMGLECSVWRCENSLVDHFNDDLDTYADGFLTSYTGTETRVRPWGSCNSVPTIGISDGVFKGSQTLEIFAVPHSDNFTTIGAEAFMDSTLRVVDLFDSVTTIGARAFANCAQLEELTIPESVTSIGNGAFDGLTGLKKLTILCDPALIPEGSFLVNGAPVEAEVRLASSATDEQLTQTSEALNRPWYDPIVRVGEPSAFVRMPFEPTSAESFDFDPATGTLLAYTGTDVDVVIPRVIDGVAVTAIARNAFEACRDYTNTETTSDRAEWVHLRSVVIPETVRNLSDDLFSYCQQLETVVCYAPLETTGGTAFMLCRSLNNVVFVNGVREIGSYAFDSAGPLNNLYFGKHLDKIGDYAFNHSGISTFVADATEIGFSFPCCESLTSLHFTARVQRYNENVASDCPSLGEICFESTDLSGVVSGGLVFKPADKLTVRVPEGIDDENLSKAQSCVSWSDKATEVTVVTETCGHAAPAQPDVTALLPNAKLAEGAELPQPTAAPEATAEPEATEAPIATASIPAEYFGTWYGVSMTMDGATYSLAEMGMEMVLDIKEDGTLTRTVNGEAETAACAVENGVVIVDGIPATLEDGQMTIHEDGILMVFGREKASAAPEAPVTAESIPAEYTGTWYGVSMTMDGTTYSLADMGMEMVLDIKEDGTLTRTVNGEAETAVCAVENGVVIVDGIPATLEDGQMTIHEDGILLVFSAEKPEVTAQIALEDEEATLEDYLGVWTITNVTADGITLPAETAGMGGETITIFGDTCDLSLMGVSLTDLPCTMEAHRLGLTVMDSAVYLTLHTDGALSLDLDGAILWYQRTGDAPERATVDPSPAAGFDAAAYVEKKFVMTDADIDGFNMTAAMLGNYEYSLVFHENGTVDFVMAGASIPGLTWTAGTIATEGGSVEGLLIDYFTDKLNVVPTEKGLDMDYFGSMLMHFAAEE